MNSTWKQRLVPVRSASCWESKPVSAGIEGEDYETNKQMWVNAVVIVDVAIVAVAIVVVAIVVAIVERCYCWTLLLYIVVSDCKKQ